MNEEKKSGIADFFEKWGFLVAIGFAALAFLFFLFPVLDYDIKYYPPEGDAVKEYFSLNFFGLFNGEITKAWPAIIILVLLGVGVISNVVSKSFGKGKEGFAMAATFSYILAICMLFTEKEIFTFYGADMIENFHGADIAWAASVSMVLLAIAAFISFGETEYASKSSARDIAEDGVLIAAAFALNFIKLPIQAEGSINLQMLPLMIIALRRGPVQGFLCGGIVYGFLTCLTDGYGFASFPFDYLVGFGSVFVVGYFRKLILPEGNRSYRWQSMVWIVVAGALATLIRYIGSTTSSMVLWGYTLPAALAYNAVYIPVSGAFAIVVLCALQGPLAMVNAMYPSGRRAVEEKAE